MRPFRPLVFALIALLSLPGMANADEDRTFVAHLSGDEEVPPRATLAQGQAIFHLSTDGTRLEYKLRVANIENIVAAHIHRGVRGANGPVVVFLAGPFGPGGGGPLESWRKAPSRMPPPFSTRVLLGSAVARSLCRR